MHLPTPLPAALAATAAFILTHGAHAMMPFSLLAIDSGTDLQYASIHANNLSLTIGLPTTTGPAPPGIPGIDPSLYLNDTSFTLPAPSASPGAPTGGTPLFMNIATTGVQYVYVSSLTGQARITPAHTDFIPAGGVSDFRLDDAGVNLLFEGGSVAPWACGPVGGPYEIFYAVPGFDTVGCRGIALYVVVHATDAYGAWAYS